MRDKGTNAFKRHVAAKILLSGLHQWNKHHSNCLRDPGYYIDPDTMPYDDFRMWEAEVWDAYDVLLEEIGDYISDVVTRSLDQQEPNL